MNAFLLIVALLAVPARADQEAAQADALAEFDESISRNESASYWVEAPREDAVSQTNPSTAEKYKFWDKLQEKAFDQICQLIEIPISQEFKILEVLKIKAGYKRNMKRTPIGAFALLDETSAGLNLSNGWTIAQLLDTNETIGLGAKLEGTSFVVRPLKGEKSCDSFTRVINLMDFKTVLPLSRERFAKMEVGELWKIPITFTMNIGIGASASKILEGMPISVSLGTAEEGRASVSLFRMSPEAIRLRLRLEQAEVRSAGAGLSATIPAAQIGLTGAEHVLLKILQKEAAKTLNRYLSLTINAGAAQKLGTGSSLEFLLDPNDPEQMENLSRVLKGELRLLGAFKRIVSRAGDRLAGGGLLGAKEMTPQDLDDTVARFSDGLDLLPSFAGLQDFDQRPKSFNAKVPLFFAYEASRNVDTTRMLLKDEDESTFDISRASKRRAQAYFDIPFMGQIMKHDEESSVQVFTHKKGWNPTGDPMAIYIQQEGFLRRGEDLAHDMVERANALVSKAGAQRRGIDARMALPVETILPRDPGERYKRGATALTLVFNRQAVQDMIHTSAEAAARAYVETLPGPARKLMTWALGHGAVEKSGRVQYNEHAMLSAAGFDGYSEPVQVNEAAYAAREASDTIALIVEDLIDVQKAATPEEQARKFRDLLGGSGKSGLGYDAILKVLIQSVDPLDIGGEFYANITKDLEGKKDVNSRRTLRDWKSDEQVDKMSSARNRFNEPSKLSD